MTQQDSLSRIENKSEVEAYLAQIKYALEDSHTEIVFQPYRRSDKSRAERYTNGFTVRDLFPRVQLLNSDTEFNHMVFVMSFHYAEHKFTARDFPYKK
jgi:hypothetical protein